MDYKFLLLFLVCISLFHCVPRVLGTPIIGGDLADSEGYKYHVSVHKIPFGETTYEYFCGGTIIHRKYILTAASCFRLKIHERQYIDYLAEQPKIIAGTDKREGPGIEQEIVTVYIPKHYDHPPEYGNIAVAQLKDDLGMAAHGTQTWATMPLGKLPDDETNAQATFCGFGKYEFDREYNGQYLQVSSHFSEFNRYLSVKLLGKSECGLSKICCLASNNVGINTGCTGDAGGGLIFGDEIVGVYSSGPRFCDSMKEPMVFTRISLFREQIDRAMIEHAIHSDMHVLVKPSTPHQSPIHEAGRSSPHHAERSNRRKYGLFRRKSDKN